MEEARLVDDASDLLMASSCWCWLCHDLDAPCRSAKAASGVPRGAPSCLWKGEWEGERKESKKECL